MARPYCETLEIATPRVDDLIGRRSETLGEVPTIYGLLLVALLERGEPMTLEEVAERLVRAGAGAPAEVLRSLQRCRPARPPVVRDGDFYALDPHHGELDMWLFRLGLRGPRRAARQATVPPAPAAPRPGPDVPLTLKELDLAWHDTWLGSWSSQRVAVAVLDALEPQTFAEIVAFVAARTTDHSIDAVTLLERPGRRAVRTRTDGRLELAPGSDAVVRGARTAVRDRIEVARRYPRQGPAELDAITAANDKARETRAEALGALHRALVHALPAGRPALAVVLDLETGELATLAGAELTALPARLEAYDVLAAASVRATLRTVGVDPGDRRLHDLAPTQKTVTFGRGRTLRITNELLVESTVGLRRPFGDTVGAIRLAQSGDLARLRRRAEADARALAALYEYGRLHKGVRLRWGFLDELLPASWAHPDEPGLYALQVRAHDLGVPLEIVLGHRARDADPWIRAVPCRVAHDGEPWRLHLVDPTGAVVDERAIQRARVATTMHCPLSPHRVFADNSGLG